MPTLLSVRQECHGGPLLPELQASQDLHGYNRLTILIHGFNNSACTAWEGYQKFLALSDIADPAARAAMGEVCLFLWPGDSRGFGAVSYPQEIPRAKQAALLLADFLRKLAQGRSTPLEIRLVCHSLGNRLALELLENHVAHGSPPTLRFVGVLLMAAAVLVSMVEDPRALEPAVTSAGATRVLFSASDAVLKWAFPTGEFAAGKGFGTAVGRLGEPASGTWGSRADMGQFGYGHGDYWRKESTGPEMKAWLGLSTANVVLGRALLAESLPAARSIDDRQLSSRQIGGGAPPCGCSPTH